MVTMLPWRIDDVHHSWVWSCIWNSIQNATKWLWNLWNLAMNTLTWICVFVLLRQGFVSVVARISFGMLIDPVTVAVRAWLSACPSVASDVDRQLTLCELVPVGWCCQGWLGEPKDNSSPKQQRGDMPCHQATVTAGWSWQPHHCVAGNCLYIFSRHTKGETHVNSIYPQAQPRIRSTNIHEVGHTVYLTNYTCEWTHHCRASCLQPVSVSLTSHIINLTEGTCHKGVSSSAIFLCFLNPW